MVIEEVLTQVRGWITVWGNVWRTGEWLRQPCGILRNHLYREQQVVAGKRDSESLVLWDSTPSWLDAINPKLGFS